MQVRDYLKGVDTAVKYCQAREACPLGLLCATSDETQGSPLFPTFVDLAQGELLWTDARFEQRVFCIQSGLLSCVTNLEQKRKVPFALYGSGYSVGMPELYIPRAISDTYHLRALTVARVCSFSAKTLRRHLELLPPPGSQRILSCALTNLSAAAYAQLKIASKPLLYDRVVALLLRLRELGVREGRGLEPFSLTHDDVATLVGSDRVSTTRALHKLEEDGLIELGYKSLTPTEALESRAALEPDAHTEFHVPEAWT